MENKEKNLYDDLGLISSEIRNRWLRLIYNDKTSSAHFTSESNIVSSRPILYHNSLVNSEENTGEYVSEFANCLLDESESIIPLTSETELFSHMTGEDKVMVKK